MFNLLLTFWLAILELTITQHTPSSLGVVLMAIVVVDILMIWLSRIETTANQDGLDCLLWLATDIFRVIYSINQPTHQVAGNNYILLCWFYGLAFTVSMIHGGFLFLCLYMVLDRKDILFRETLCHTNEHAYHEIP